MILSNLNRSSSTLHFVRILSRNFKRLVLCNLLYLLFCLPVFTAPAAMAAQSRITLSMARESHFFWSDFWDTFRGEFRRALLSGILLFGGCAAAAVGFFFYRDLSGLLPVMLLPAWVCAAALLLLSVMSAYVFPMLAILDLPLKAIFRNAFLLVFLRLPQNLLMVLLQGIITGICFLFFPLSIPLVLFLASSLQSLIGAAFVWPGIEKVIRRGEGKS